VKSGDVVINVNDLVTVKFKGWIAGSLSTYEIEFDVPAEKGVYPAFQQTTTFTGTVPDVLERTGRLIRTYNAQIVGKQGGLII